MQNLSQAQKRFQQIKQLEKARALRNKELNERKQALMAAGHQVDLGLLQRVLRARREKNF